MMYFFNERCGLAGSCAGHNQHWAVKMFNSLLLTVVNVACHVATIVSQGAHRPHLVNTEENEVFQTFIYTYICAIGSIQVEIRPFQRFVPLDFLCFAK
jgi:hypothetical protein